MESEMTFPARYNGQARFAVKDGYRVLWITVPCETLASPMLGECCFWYDREG